jgi:Protein of unknown function (DUF1572)
MLTQSYIDDVLARFQDLKKLADAAIAQVEPDELFQTLDDESNSIAITMKHIAGNMRSRWRDFLTTDGEKPDRNRDQEFVLTSADSAETLNQLWQTGWNYLFEAIRALSPDDLSKTVLIRNEPHRVFQAINRQLTHYGCHVGQIVFLAKHFASAHWKSLSIPRGKSQAFNKKRGLDFVPDSSSENEEIK